MPTIVLPNIVERVIRLPHPSLQTYVAFSVLVMSAAVHHAIHKTSQPDWKLNSTLAIDDGDATTPSQSPPTDRYRVTDVILYMLEEPICISTLINMAYCCLVLIVKLIQRIVFGELRVSEQQHVKDKFWNFVFYKFIFIFGVMNVQFMDEVILWCGWFSILGFLHLLAQLSKDRFEYVSFSPTTPKWTHIRLLSLLVSILGLSSALYIVCILVGLHAGINTFAFMAAECVLLNIQTLYVIVRYAIHLYDINLEGTWENRGTYVYYAELGFEINALIVDFCHHLHMLVWGNIFLSMASLVICMQLRCLFYEIQRRVKKHKNFLRVVRHLEKHFPMATADELEANSDDCAICWDKMESARKLPCGHLFHNSCLRSWLEQDTSCPTCRTSLAYPADGGNGAVSDNEDEGPETPSPGQQERPTTNHFFHFDGSRYVSWLPSFSVEVTHLQLLRGEQHPIQTSQLDGMVNQIQQLFPNYPVATIVDDLLASRSVEQTIENILDGRLVVPPFQTQNSRSTSIQPPDDVAQDNSSNRPSSSGDEGGLALSDFDYDSEPFEGCSNCTSEPAEECSDIEGPEPMLNSSGGRFSKSSREREAMLANRKDELLKLAKRRYLAKHTSRGKSTVSSGNVGESLESRRHRAYVAARRRLLQQHDVT